MYPRERDRWYRQEDVGNSQAVPPLDIYEGDGMLHIEVELPGVDPEEISISVEGERVIIEGFKTDASMEAGDHIIHFHLMERYLGPFKRQLRLSPIPDPQGIEATYKNGVLTITLRFPDDESEEE
jgi:HSP20 family protein